MQTLPAQARDSTAFSTFESKSDNGRNHERSVKSNYRSSHDTPEEPEEEVLEQIPSIDVDSKTPTPLAESGTESHTPPAEEVILVQTPPATTQRVDEENTMLYPYPK